MSEMNPRHCTACGAQLAEGSSFCTSCGAPVHAQAPGPTPHVVTGPSRCPSCDAPVKRGASFCTTCNHGLLSGQAELKLVRSGERIGTLTVDLLITPLTLIIGWLIWLAIVAPRGQTPAMSLLKIRCVDDTGTTASAGRMWLRQLVPVAYFLIGFLTVGTIAYSWAFWDKDRQTLHDKLAGTFVVYGEPETAP